MFRLDTEIKKGYDPIVCAPRNNTVLEEAKQICKRLGADITKSDDRWPIQ